LGRQCEARDVFNEIVELATSSDPIGTSTTYGDPGIITGYHQTNQILGQLPWCHHA